MLAHCVRLVIPRAFEVGDTPARMPRNAEVVRQWKLLLHLDGVKQGKSVDELAAGLSVSKRTIWRDLAALQEAGFPLIDEKRDRRTTWRVMHQPLRALTDAGLSVTEICSLYMSRELLLTLTGTPFESDLNSLLKKILKALSPRKKVSAGYNELVATLIEASSRRKAIEMRYFSVSSNRQKDYNVHPYLVEYADAGLYLRAYVPEYDEIRLFAVERIKRCKVTEQSFTTVQAVAGADFEPSLGLGNGKPEKVQLEFSARVAPYVRERVWHKSQQIEERPDGGVRLAMIDHALIGAAVGEQQHLAHGISVTF